MGFKKKVAQVSTDSAIEVVESMSAAMINQISKPSAYVAKIVKYLGGNQYVVKGQNGEDKTITFAGDKLPIPGKGMLVNGDYGL